jgi:hypothetical protein
MLTTRPPKVPEVSMLTTRPPKPLTRIFESYMELKCFGNLQRTGEKSQKNLAAKLEIGIT